jgi:hypothetical protein
MSTERNRMPKTTLTAKTKLTLKGRKKGGAMEKIMRTLVEIEDEIKEELEGAYQVGLAYYRRVGE